jgi:hypothetical protein
MVLLRAATAGLVLSIAASGMLQSAALAQTPPESPTAPETAPVPRQAGARIDAYDVGAAAANVLWVPFKIGQCGIGAGVGIVGFVLTLGFARDWTLSAMEEACARDWLLSGDDFRPDRSPAAVSGVERSPSTP